MDTGNDPDERVVYLAFKRAFVGTRPECHRLDYVTSAVEKLRERGLVAYLLRQHGTLPVCRKALQLLCAGVFSSTTEAKRRFPEVFALSDTGSLRREELEDGALQVEMDLLKNAVHGHRRLLESVHSRDTAPGQPGRNTTAPSCIRSVAMLTPRAVQNSASQPTSPDMAIESLFPVYLPFDAQYAVVQKADALLQSACYGFGQRNTPDVLQKHGWNCAESADLTVWAEELWSRSADLPPATSTSPSLGTLLASMAAIRCVVTYRLPITARLLCRLLHHTQVLVRRLGLLRTPYPLRTGYRRIQRRQLCTWKRRSSVFDQQSTKVLWRKAVYK